MATEAQQAERVKRITDQLELTFQALRGAAANISGLLQMGRATCEEVRAYNAWAIAIFEAQRGMLTTLRGAGQTDLPAQPSPPTLFPIRGRSGTEAVLIDCGGSGTLAGLMSAAMNPGKSTKLLSTNEIEISTSDPHVYNPSAAPSFQQLLALQSQRQAGLGVAPLVILIGAIVVAIVVSAALTALFKYLETNSIQEANTEIVRQQAQAFAKYTEARLSCLAQCTQSGRSIDDCTSTCDKLIDKPEFKLPGEGKWGVLEWTGFTVLLGAGLWIGWKIYERKKAGRPILELPDSIDDVMS